MNDKTKMILLMVMTLPIWFSCSSPQNSNKTTNQYSYIESSIAFNPYTPSIERLESSPQMFTAPNDSIAMIEAYKMFSMSKVSYEAKKKEDLFYPVEPESFVVKRKDGSICSFELNQGVKDSLELLVRQQYETMNR